jgi:hypothetical protein
MYIDIIELLEVIKEACRKNECKDCPFSGTYSHMGDNAAFYYCRIADTPNEWQIDSAGDDEVLYDIKDFEKVLYDVEDFEKDYKEG